MHWNLLKTRTRKKQQLLMHPQVVKTKVALNYEKKFASLLFLCKAPCKPENVSSKKKSKHTTMFTTL